MTVSNGSAFASVNMTPSDVKRSMPPRILIEPSLIPASVPISISGTRPSSSTICRGPFAARRNPRRSMLPTASRNTGALMKSTRRAGKRRYRIAHDRIGNPSKSRGRIWTGPRTANATSTPALARSSAISPPELPKPTTSTRFPAHKSGLRYSLLWITRPEKVSNPGHDGRYGASAMPVAMTIADAVIGPRTVSAHHRAPSRRIRETSVLNTGRMSKRAA